jgi:hypothetical protein
MVLAMHHCPPEEVGFVEAGGFGVTGVIIPAGGVVGIGLVPIGAGGESTGFIPAGGVVGIGLIPIDAGGESTGFTIGVVPGVVGLMTGTPPVTVSSWVVDTACEMSILFSWSPTILCFWIDSKAGVPATLG